MDHVENIVVGGGVVGLAICRELNKAGRETILLENNYFGEDASTRNSGVIHAGIYYNPGSLKAQLCVKGNKHYYTSMQKILMYHLKTWKNYLLQFN